MRISLSLLTLILLISSIVQAQEKKLVIHEWGTFTSLQDSTGRTLGGINVDDEPVPDFVHTLDRSVVVNSPSKSDPAALTKGIVPAFHPHATMRLETPVVYFYPPNPAMDLDLSVTFIGGYLSQFYPNVTGPNLQIGQTLYTAGISPDTAHTITWSKLHLGGDVAGPKTDARVWTSPRAVKSANVTAQNGESEKFLFYRGVGHVQLPVQIVRHGELLIIEGEMAQLPPVKGRSLKNSWLVEIRNDGKVAFKHHEELNANPPPDGGTRCFRPFLEANYSAENLPKLRDTLRHALIKDGLFEDEADAMLNTWEKSYFKQIGLRVLYIVPKVNIEDLLPMNVSVPADISRVMVGRIELITPAQEAMVQTITDRNDIPKLGRFAAAIMNEENRVRPRPELQKLIEACGFTPVKVAQQ